MKRTNRHNYTQKQDKWMKDCVLPPFSNKSEVRSLVDQFNSTFDASLSFKAFYTHAAYLQGKWKAPSRSLSKKTIRKVIRNLSSIKTARASRKHTYTFVQTQWLRTCTIPMTNSLGLKHLAQTFNKTFGTSVSPAGIYAKAAKLQGRWKSGAHNQHIIEPTTFKQPLSIKMDQPITISDIMSEPPLFFGNQSGKFKVIANDKVIWSSDKKPVVDTGCSSCCNS
jgi:hypothetical protein